MTFSIRSARRAVTALGAGVVAASCGSLDVTNPNAPDRTRAIALSGDVVNLVGGAFQNWYNAQQLAAPGITAAVMANQFSMSWGNFGARVYSSVPRVQFNNVATDQNIGVVDVPWYNNYSALAAANIALVQAADTSVFGAADSTNRNLVQASATFMQGATLANIALFFNQGFIVDETTDVLNVDFSDRAAVRDAALAKLDQAITLSQRSFKLPNSFLNSPGWSNTQLAQMANTQAARLIAYFPRSASENATASWARVVTYASRGISSGAAFDAVSTGDGCTNWCDEHKVYLEDWDTWARVNQRVVNELDPSQPARHPLTGTPPAPRSTDARFDPTPRDDGSAGSEDTPDFLYVTYENFNPARGRYHFSNVGHNRYHRHGVLDPTEGGVGTVPFLLAAENDLLWAEGLVRSGGSRAQAAQLINKTRVGRGQLPALTGSETSAAGMVGLATNMPAADASNILLRAIFYERDVELAASSGITPFYDARRTDRFTNYFVVNAGDLANTPRQFPVPARELETLRRQLYTFRGADSVSLGARAAATMLSLSMAGPSGRAQLLRAAEVGEVGKIASLYRQAAHGRLLARRREF